MDKSLFNQQQKRIVTLLRKYGGRKPFSGLCEDSCSELSRLLSCWIIKDHPKATILILKGDKVFNTKRSHDIVLVEEDKKSFLVDPSVWQFFKRKRSILVGEVKNVDEALKLAHKIYKGTWFVSEKIGKNICKESKGLEMIIKTNAQ